MFNFFNNDRYIAFAAAVGFYSFGIASLPSKEMLTQDPKLAHDQLLTGMSLMLLGTVILIAKYMQMGNEEEVRQQPPQPRQT